MRQETIIECKCGKPLYRYGLYLYCTACKSLYYSQDNKSLQQLSDNYYCLHYSYPQFIEQIIEKIIPNASLDLFNNIKEIIKETIIVPYVNLFINKKDTLYPIIKLEANSVWTAEDIPVIEDYISFNLSQKTVSAIDKHIKTGDCDLQKMEELRMSYGYVSSKVYYIPVQILKFAYKGNYYCFANYGDKIVSLRTQPNNLISKSDENRTENFHKLVSCIMFILLVGLIACSWYITCYTFQSIHGLLNLFWYAIGYKCFFKFLGFVIAEIIGVCCLDYSVKYLSNIFNENKKQTTSKKHNIQLKAKAFSALHI